ncbi:MAG TPA: hypothetical protein ENK46_04515 [Flavobacteriia bacterium]|jgi:hypothetical protein|nr:hypothetical protein [Flavobacteriia bacterium]
MKKNEIIKALKNGKNKEELLDIIGSPEVNLETITGGQQEPFRSSGYICTLSGECNGTGKSCWPWPF